jgi:hypothetical protein
MKTIKADVCVIGAGSGGIGAAIGASNSGASVVLVEKNQIPGGTVTMSWVHTWEPVCGTSFLCEKIWNRMKKIPFGASDKEYSLSKSRLNGETGQVNPSFPFEPWAYLMAVDAELKGSGVDNILYGTSFVSSCSNGREINKVRCLNSSGIVEIEAKYFIDCTDEIYLAREAGCDCSLGAENRYEYDEPSAPENADRMGLNPVNWIYRVRPVDHEVVVDKSEVPENSQINNLFAPQMPNGDILVNVCGCGVFSPEKPESWKKVLLEQKQIAWDSYRWQIISGRHKNWEFVGFAPQLGIREGYRLKALKVVDENDIICGITERNKDQFIATCDHRLDIHGSPLSRELTSPFGITIESVIAKEYDNLLVASRGAGFSHIAAGSCRLARTIMTIGEAAGKFAANNL